MYHLFFQRFSLLKKSALSAGFSLIELLVVIAILGTLTGLAATNFGNSQAKARDARRKSDLAQIQRALELYYNDHGRYPNESNNQIAACGASSTSVCPWGSPMQDGAGTIYLETLPKDPRTSNTYFYNVDQSNFLRYQLFARLENANDPILDRNGDGEADDYTKNCGGANCNYAVHSPNTDGDASF
jgi:general secretion pathway protein G